MRINITPPGPQVWADFEQIHLDYNKPVPPKPPAALFAVLTQTRNGEWTELIERGALPQVAETYFGVIAGVCLYPTEGLPYVLVDNLMVNPVYPLRWRHAAVAALVRPVLTYCAAQAKAPVAFVQSRSLAKLLIQGGWKVAPGLPLVRLPELSTSHVFDTTDRTAPVRPPAPKRRRG